MRSPAVAEYFDARPLDYVLVAVVHFVVPLVGRAFAVRVLLFVGLSGTCVPKMPHAGLKLITAGLE